MNATTVAKHVLSHFKGEAAVTMVAVMGAESGFNPKAQGDAVSAFPPSQRPTYARYACQGYTSIGLGQVNMRWHYDKLKAMTGSSDPCVWAEWLKKPANNARLCHAIYAAAANSFTPWAAFTAGTYRAFTGRARAAVAEAKKSLTKPAPTKPPKDDTPSTVVLPTAAYDKAVRALQTAQAQLAKGKRR